MGRAEAWGEEDTGGEGCADMIQEGRGVPTQKENAIKLLPTLRAPLEWPSSAVPVGGGLAGRGRPG